MQECNPVQSLENWVLGNYFNLFPVLVNDTENKTKQKNPDK